MTNLVNRKSNQLLFFTACLILPALFMFESCEKEKTPHEQVITVSTVAGSTAGSSGRGYADGQGTAALFEEPMSLAIDQASNIYVADYYNSVIRKVSPSGYVSTLVGNAHKQGDYVDGTADVALFWGPDG